MHVDSIALLVKNINDAGPGSLRNAIAAAGEGDTIRFRNTVVNDTIVLTTPIALNRDVNIIQLPAQPVFIQGIATHVLGIGSGSDVRLSNIRIIGGNAPVSCIVNLGDLTLEHVNLYSNWSTMSVHNQGVLHVKGNCRLE
jgi:hypothetical protein